jgi:bacterioferritin-associated ferredoxin
VYFHRDIHLVVGTSEVRTRVGYKVDTDPIPVCYCIGVLAETIREEIVVKGCCDSLEDIQRYTGARTGKWCHITNPSGRCCGPMVQRVIEAALRERVEASLAEQARRLAEEIPSDGAGEASDVRPDTCCRL